VEGILRVNEEGVYWTPPISGGGGGSAGRTQSQQQASTYDPELSAINRLARTQLEAGISQTGGLPSYLKPNPFALPTGEERGLYGEIAALKDKPLMTPLEASGLSRLETLADPSKQLEYASNLYNQYAAPIIRNDATVRGQGRQGVIPESLAAGFAQMALPIIQGAQGAGSELAKTSLLLGPSLEQRNLARIEQAIQATQAPRLAESAEYMRPLATIANMIGGLPYGGGSVSGYQTGRTKATRGDFDVLGDLLIPLIGAVAGGVAACYLSTAALVPSRAIQWRVYLSWQAPLWERVAYRALSVVTKGRSKWSRALMRRWAHWRLA